MPRLTTKIGEKDYRRWEKENEKEKEKEEKLEEKIRQLRKERNKNRNRKPHAGQHQPAGKRRKLGENNYEENSKTLGRPEEKEKGIKRQENQPNPGKENEEPRAKKFKQLDIRTMSKTSTEKADPLSPQQTGQEEEPAARSSPRHPDICQTTTQTPAKTNLQSPDLPTTPQQMVKNDNNITSTLENTPTVELGMTNEWKSQKDVNNCTTTLGSTNINCSQSTCTTPAQKYPIKEGNLTPVSCTTPTAKMVTTPVNMNITKDYKVPSTTPALTELELQLPMSCTTPAKNSAKMVTTTPVNLNTAYKMSSTTTALNVVQLTRRRSPGRNSTILNDKEEGTPEKWTKNLQFTPPPIKSTTPESATTAVKSCELSKFNQTDNFPKKKVTQKKVKNLFILVPNSTPKCIMFKGDVKNNIRWNEISKNDSGILTTIEVIDFGLKKSSRRKKPVRKKEILEGNKNKKKKEISLKIEKKEIYERNLGITSTAKKKKNEKCLKRLKEIRNSPFKETSPGAKKIPNKKYNLNGFKFKNIQQYFEGNSNSNKLNQDRKGKLNASEYKIDTSVTANQSKFNKQSINKMIEDYERKNLIGHASLPGD